MANEKVSKEQKEEVRTEEAKPFDAKAYRASLYKAIPRVLNDQEKREAFRIYWAQEKSKYGKSKDLEQILWLHLKSMKMDGPEEFEAGIKHFGLSKVR